MTKATLVNEVVKETGLLKKDAQAIVELIFAKMKNAFRQSERVELRGFGVFVPKKRRPRVGRNPKTREEVKIPARTVIVFKPSKLLKLS